MEYTYHYDSPLGGITLTSNGNELTGLSFDRQPYSADTLPKEYRETRLPVFDETVKWLDLYFGGKEPGFTPALKTESTPFRTAVWKILLTVPYGKTVSYKEIAERIAKQKGMTAMSAQAVGGAVGHNPIAIIIPCHRVIGSNGALIGYGAGTDTKSRLLELERSGLKNAKTYRFSAQIHADPESGGAYIVFPYDIRKEFGKGRVKVHAEFDGIPYDGSIVNMGVKDETGDIRYVIGVLKSIRKQLGKNDGDTLEVRIFET